jgi:predicted PurR-regulated permease PerM
MVSPQDEKRHSVFEIIGDRILLGLMIEKRILLAILGIAALFALHFFSGMLVPVFLAVFFYIVFRPLMDLLNLLKIPDAVGAGIIVFLMVIMMVGGLYSLSGPARDWMEKGPYLFSTVEFRFQSFLQTIKGAKKATQQLEEMMQLEEEIGEKEKVVVQSPSVADQAFVKMRSTAADAAIIVVLLYFMLACGKKTLHRLYAIWEDQKERQEKLAIFTQIQEQISIYLLTFVLINGGLAVATTGVMFLLEMPNPALWGVLAGLLNFLPYLGPAIMTIVLGAVALVTFSTWFQILAPPLIYFAMTAVEGNFITPTIMGKRLTLNPMMIFLSVFFWGWLWGIVGVFLAIPMLGAIKIVSKNINSLKPLREVLR